MNRKGFTQEKETVERVLRDGKFLTLSIFDEQGVYGVPINYGYADGNLYVHSSARGRKFEALTAGREICFSIVADHRLITDEKACKWSYRYSSVIGFGIPKLMEDDEEKSRALSVIMDQYGEGTWHFDSAALKAAAVFEIPVDRISARIRD